MNVLKPMLTLLLVAATGNVFAEEAVEPPRTERAAAAAWSGDGLQETKLDGVDLAYARPGADLSAYQRVLVRAPTVAFRRGWERNVSSRPSGRVRPDDAQKIRDRLSAGVLEEVVKELGAGGHVVVDAAGEDVLEIRLAIIDLYIAAPEHRNAPDEVFAVSAGEMTLIAELVDSQSGEVQMRLFDHAEAREHGQIHRIFHSGNEQEARAIANEWAKVIRRELDAARGASATP